MDLLTSRVALRRWTVASLVSNMTLIVTGGLVRVTQSGLGCSTWPQCEPGSYLPHPEAGAHAFIEFGNRLLTFVLVAVALGTLLAAWRARDGAGNPRRRLRAPAPGGGRAAPGTPRARRGPASGRPPCGQPPGSPRRRSSAAFRFSPTSTRGWSELTCCRRSR